MAKAALAVAVGASNVGTFSIAVEQHYTDRAIVIVTPERPDFALKEFESELARRLKATNWHTDTLSGLPLSGGYAWVVFQRHVRWQWSGALLGKELTAAAVAAGRPYLSSGVLVTDTGQQFTAWDFEHSIPHTNLWADRQWTPYKRLAGEEHRAWHIGFGHLPSIAVQNVLRSHSARHWLAAALMVQEAWSEQRNSWAKNELRLGPRSVSTKQRVLALDPEHIRARLAIRREKNWRNRALSALRSLSLVAVVKSVEMGAAEPMVLQTVLDGRKIGAMQGVSGPAGELARQLLKAGVKSSPLFFAVLAPNFARLLPFPVVDGRGQVTWGKAAIAQARALHQSSDSDWAESVFERAKLESVVRHFQVPQGLLPTLAVAGAGGRALTLALVLFSERRAGRPGDDVLGVPCNGSKGHGYRPTTWLRKCTPGKQDFTAHDFRELADSLETLDSCFGIDAQLGSLNGLSAVLDELRALGGRKSRDRHTLRLFLKDGWELRLVAVKEVTSIATKPLDGPGLRALRRRAQLTQSVLGAAIGVGKATISKWESGASDIPGARVEQLLGFFHPEEPEPDGAATGG